MPKLRCRSSRNLSRLTHNSLSPPVKFEAVSITEQCVDLLALVATKVTKAGCNLSACTSYTPISHRGTLNRRDTAGA